MFYEDLWDVFLHTGKIYVFRKGLPAVYAKKMTLSCSKRSDFWPFRGNQYKKG